MSPGINQSTTSGRMKLTFVILCVIICVISLVFYSNTTLNWKLLHTFLAQSLVVISRPSKNITASIDRNISTLSRRRFVIFACSIHAKTQAYTFYTPITASSWQRVGYETIVVFVGDFTLPNVLTARLNLSRTYLKHVGAYIIDLQCNASYAVKLSQLVRVFAGLLPDSIVHDEDDIITGDSDLMPLKAKEYVPTNGTDGFIFNAFCCGSFRRRGRSYRMFPITLLRINHFVYTADPYQFHERELLHMKFLSLVGHIYLKKKSWRALLMESKQRSELLVNADARTRELLSENASLSFDTISVYVRHEFKGVYDSDMKKGDVAWYMDQVFCSMLLTDYREKHKNFKVNERGRAARLDRASSVAYWNRDKFDQFGDAHLFHDTILQAGNWKIFNKLLKALFNDNLVKLFNDYYQQYMIADKIPVKQKRKR